MSTLVAFQDKPVNPNRQSTEKGAKTCPKCASVLQGVNDRCNSCGVEYSPRQGFWGSLKIVQQFGDLLSEPDCTCGLRSCDECSSPSGIFCGECGQPCGMKMFRDGSVQSSCCGDWLYRDRTLTRAWEDDAAEHELNKRMA